MKKVNLVKLLKDCPTGMELDCTICNGLKFIELDRNPNFPIVVRANNGYEFSLTKYGQVHNIDDAKCVIFPKGKTTWEGFVPPCKFKDGDIISDSLGTCIFKGEGEFEGTVNYYCGISNDYFRVKDDKRNPSGHYGCIVGYRLSTEEEKQKLFDAIKANGYKWNAETKTLEKFIEPKFKVGDKIKFKDGIDKNGVKEGIILSITDDAYDVAVTNDMGIIVPIANQDNWELVPNKFDINTLVPFESRVLVRGADGDLWKPAIYGFSHSKGFYVVGGIYWRQCIPYEGNEHLRGKTDDCDDFYKNWE